MHWVYLFVSLCKAVMHMLYFFILCNLYMVLYCIYLYLMRDSKLCDKLIELESVLSLLTCSETLLGLFNKIVTCIILLICSLCSSDGDA